MIGETAKPFFVVLKCGAVVKDGVPRFPSLTMLRTGTSWACGRTWL